MFFLDNFKNDCILYTLFLSKSDAVKGVRRVFEDYYCVIAVYCVLLHCI